MNIIATSDWHGNLFDVPDCDILVLAGDICGHGPALRIGMFLEYTESQFQKRWIFNQLIPHLNKFNIGTTIAVLGNHDFCKLTEEDTICMAEGGLIVLNNNTWCDLDQSGLSFFGTPHSLKIDRWTNGVTDNSGFTDSYDKNADIVISHGPPWGILDENVRKKNCGSQELRDWCETKSRAKAFICGHIHESHGKVEFKPGKTCYNVSALDENYQPHQNIFTQISL